jgi:antitoxin ChpS
MLTTTLRKVGGSVMMAVPPAILDMLRLGAGATVALNVDGDRLVVESAPKLRYRLEDLLEQCDPNAPLSDEDRVWLDAPMAGREIL